MSAPPIQRSQSGPRILVRGPLCVRSDLRVAPASYVHYSGGMTNTEILSRYTTIRRNGSKVASMNTFVIMQVHINERGALVRYVARNPETGAMISISARDAESWHVVS